MKKVLCVLTLLAALAGCATTGVSLVGERTYAPLQATQPVLVFSRESEVKRAFEVIAMINHTDPGKWQILTLESAMPALKDKARAVGANGLIIDEYRTIRSGLVSTGVYVKARAIFIKD